MIELIKNKNTFCHVEILEVDFLIEVYREEKIKINIGVMG